MENTGRWIPGKRRENDQTNLADLTGFNPVPQQTLVNKENDFVEVQRSGARQKRGWAMVNGELIRRIITSY